MGSAAYWTVLRTAGIPWVIVSSTVARLPLGMYSLALVLVTHQRSGSFAMSGATVAAFAAAAALGAPLLGRMVDRRGARPVLICTSLAHGAAMIAQLPVAGEPVGVAMAGVAGVVFPPMSASLRSLWSVLLSEPQARNAAFSLDAVVSESVFLVGPLLVSLFVVTVGGAGAVTAGAVLTMLGSLVFAFLAPVRLLAPKSAQGSPVGDLVGALRIVGLDVLVIVELLLFVSFGLVEIAVSAAAIQHRVASSAGVLLAVWSAASLLGGLIWGSRRWPGSPQRQLVFLYGFVALGLLPLGVSTQPAVLAVLLVTAGVMIAPAATVLQTLVAGLVPSHLRAEGYAWLASAALAGTSLGVLVGGASVDRFGPALTFVLATVLVATATAVLGVCARALHRE